MKAAHTHRGSARAKRRENMGQFRKAQNERRALIAASTHTATMVTHRPAAPLPMPVRRVLTCTDEGAGQFSVRLYETTKDYPAGTPCPNRARLHSYGWMSYPQALAALERG